MGIPVGTRYTATVSASVWKTVSCASCPCDFAYKLSRQAQGMGASPLWLDNQGAKNRASAEARARLEKLLATASDVVWCPRCGSYQPSMFGRVRWKANQRWLIVAGALLGVAMFTQAAPVVAVPLGALALSLGAAVFFFVKQSKFDPNADAALRLQQAAPQANELMLREEYEAGLEVALAKGLKAENLLSLRWDRASRLAGSAPTHAPPESAPAGAGRLDGESVLSSGGGVGEVPPSLRN